MENERGREEVRSKRVCELQYFKIVRKLRNKDMLFTRDLYWGGGFYIERAIERDSNK